MNNSLTPNACSCHVINPTKTPILAWLRKEKILVKIADQLFIGAIRTDKNGERYWKCKDLLPTKEQVNSETNQEK